MREGEGERDGKRGDGEEGRRREGGGRQGYGKGDGKGARARVKEMR